MSLDRADVDVAEAHRGLAGLDAGGVVEDDLDQRAAVGIGPPGHPERETSASSGTSQTARAAAGLGARVSTSGAGLGAGGGSVSGMQRGSGSALSQIRRGSRACAESMVKATESAKKTAAGRG